MKKHFKLLALILSLCLALSLLVACNGNDTEKTPTDDTNTENRSEASLEETSETSIEELINIPKTDYGEDFLMLVNPDTNKFHYHWAYKGRCRAISCVLYVFQSDKLQQKDQADLSVTSKY